MIIIILKDSKPVYIGNEILNLNVMATRKNAAGKSKSKADLEILKSSENFLIEKEKRYQKKVRRPQVENLTTLKETKKKSVPVKPPAKKTKKK